MILQCVVYRVSDGLPLSGSTDMQPSADMKQCLKIIKALSKRLVQLPQRCVMEVTGCNIFFVSSEEISVLVLCEASYPHVLAYCFLEEVKKEFQRCYDKTRIKTARRPYALIEFEIFLQKSKQRFKNTRGLTTQVNVSSMSSDLKTRPPYKVLEADIGNNHANGVYMEHKDTHRPFMGPGRRFIPLNWIGMLAILMNLFCVVLNLTRGMAVISHGHFDISLSYMWAYGRSDNIDQPRMCVDEDDLAYRYGFSFLLAASVCLYQIRLLFFVCRWRYLQTFLCLATLCWCCFFLRSFRNSTQIAFHVTSAVFTTTVVLCRKLTEKLPGYSV